MLIDRTHKPWFVGSVLVLTSAAAAYWAMEKRSMHGPTGGSVLGLVFGIAGSLLMIFAALLAVRKRLPTWRVGSAQFWLRGHLWLGTLGFVLILFHASFGWGGLLENLLWISFGLVVVTGFAGVVLQQVIPRLLTTRVPLETMVAQIPFLSQTMQFRADQLVAKQAGVLDVDYEPLKPFAEEVLKQQRVLKRESDFPKELAKVYANVPLPEADGKKPTAHAPAEIIATKPTSPNAAPLPPGEGGRRPGEGSEGNTLPNALAATPPAAKPKSPLELMREKAAAKIAGGESPAPASANPGPPAAAAEPEKKLSPLEQMRAKTAAKPSPQPIAESPAPAAEAPVLAEVKKQSPLEQMRAKMAAKSAPPPSEAAPATEVPAAPTPEKKLSPLQQMQAKLAAAKGSSTEVPAAPTPEKKLSPLQQMQAKLAAAKGSSTDPTTEPHKPLTVEKSVASELSAADTPAPPAVKKPAAVAKPISEKPAAIATSKSPAKIAAPIPPALLTELRDFHIRVVRSFLSTGRSPQHRLDEGISARRLFAQLRSDLPAELHESIQELEDLCEERRQFNTQLRLHRWLHWWLILHIPPSIALLVLFVAHVIVSLRVVPFGR